MDDDAKSGDAQRQPGENSKAEEGSPSKPAAKKPKILFLIAGVVIIALLGVAGYLIFARSTQASETPEETTVEATEQVDQVETTDETPARKPRRTSNKTDVKGTDIYFTDFPVSIVNLGPCDGYNYVYLKYGFNLEVASEEVKVELAQKLPKIASKVDGVLTGRRWDQIGSQRGRVALEKEIVEVVNEELEAGDVIACYITTFVAQ